MLANEHVNMSWNIKYNTRKESTARRPDVTINYTERKVIHMIDMASLSVKNVLAKNKEKRHRSISSSPLRLERDDQDTECKLSR